jgi:hypothetical protein
MTLDLIIRLLGQDVSAKSSLQGVAKEATAVERALDKIGASKGLDAAGTSADRLGLA